MVLVQLGYHEDTAPGPPGFHQDYLDGLELLQDLNRLVLGLQEDGGNVQQGKGHGPPYSMSSHISGRSVINLSSLHDSFIVRYTVLLVHLLHVPSVG